MIAKGLIIYIVVVLVALVLRIVYIRRQNKNDSKNRK